MVTGISFSDLSGVGDSASSIPTFVPESSFEAPAAAAGGPLGGITGASIAGSVGSFFGAAGDFAEGSAYGTAAKYAQINAGIEAEAGKIRQTQTQRQIYQVLGSQQAAYAGNGLKANAGSAVDVARNTVQQGALEKAIIAEQTSINVQGYEAQAAQFKGMQTAADLAGAGGVVNGVLGLFGL